MLGKFIVYACPVGELAVQLEAYFQESRRLCGVNPAHRYMPHCTLTSFFEDGLETVPFYLQGLHQAYLDAFPTRPDPVIRIADVQFQPEWHGFELESDWLKKLIAEFINQAHSPTCQEPLRRKEWLHLSFAYDFLPQNYKTLVRLAQNLIDPQASVRWELRFYERHADWTWTCHQAWSLDTRRGDS